MSGNKKHWWLYILKLEQDKWYVGITSKSPEHRLRQHQRGLFAANWTRKYKPIKIHDKKYLGECELERIHLYEGRVTREYMEKYGDNNVRGGDLTDVRDYTRRFGRIWLKDEWETLTFIVFMMAVVAYLVVDKYFL